MRGSCESATSCGHNSEQLGKVEMVCSDISYSHHQADLGFPSFFITIDTCPDCAGICSGATVLVKVRKHLMLLPSSPCILTVCLSNA